MRKSLSISTAFLAGLLCTGFWIPASTDQEWGWFAAGSVINMWEIFQGKAQVRISGNIFFAELYSPKPSDPELAVQITLRGKIRDGKIEVIAQQHFTDDPPRKLEGVYKKTLWKNGGGREAIILTQPDAPEGLTIGLTRELAKR